MNKPINVHQGFSLGYEFVDDRELRKKLGQYKTKLRALPPRQGTGSIQQWFRTHPLRRKKATK